MYRCQYSGQHLTIQMHRRSEKSCPSFVSTSILEKRRCATILMDCILLCSSNSDPYNHIQVTLFGENEAFFSGVGGIHKNRLRMKIVIECLALLLHIQVLGSNTWVFLGYAESREVNTRDRESAQKIASCSTRYITYTCEKVSLNNEETNKYTQLI
jgi:hypothetical protein